MLVLVWLLGCTSPCAGLDVVVGSGFDAFEPFGDDDEVTMVYGPQGGWHVDVSARVSGLGPEVEVLPAIRRVSDGLALAGDQYTTFLLLADYDDASCAGDVLGVRAFLDDATPEGDYADFICSLDGAAIEIVVDVADFDGRSASGAATVTARTDPGQSCP